MLRIEQKHPPSGKKAGVTQQLMRRQLMVDV